MISNNKKIQQKLLYPNKNKKEQIFKKLVKLDFLFYFYPKKRNLTKFQFIFRKNFKKKQKQKISFKKKKKYTKEKKKN